MNKRIAVIIPCYRVKKQILKVLGSIGDEVSQIVVVDDCCPEESGKYVEDCCDDPRVRVVFNSQNLGVGGAVMAGYRVAMDSKAEILVKIDGDGQMDPAILPRIVQPIIEGRADYTKGNRFYDLENIVRMPRVRIFGNAVLSFMCKMSTGYWHLFDPTNGYTAIDSRVASHLPLNRVSQRYFFETDMLFRLNTLRAVVVDVPMDPVYQDEQSSLEVRKIIGEFFKGHARNFLKRIFYNYFLRDMSLASFELVVGLALLLFGTIYGAIHWYASIISGQAEPLGVIMLATLPIISGLQFLLAFFSYDIAAVPDQPVSNFLQLKNQ